MNVHIDSMAPWCRCCAAEAASHEFLSGVPLDSSRSLASQRSVRNANSLEWQANNAADDLAKPQLRKGNGRLQPSTTWLRLLDGALQRSTSLPDGSQDLNVKSPAAKRRCAAQDAAPAGDLSGLLHATAGVVVMFAWCWWVPQAHRA